MLNAMFKHIILSSNHHGQLHAGFAKTIKFCRNLILPHLDVHSVRSDDILEQIYNICIRKIWNFKVHD